MSEWLVKGYIHNSATFIVEADSPEEAKKSVKRGDWYDVVHEEMYDWGIEERAEVEEVEVFGQNV